MFRADADRYLPFFSDLVQLKSLEHRPEKHSNLKKNCSKTFQEDLSKGFISKVEQTGCFKVGKSQGT